MGKDPLVTDIIYRKFGETFRNPEDSKLLLFTDKNFEQCVQVPPHSSGIQKLESFYNCIQKSLYSGNSIFKELSKIPIAA